MRKDGGIDIPARVSKAGQGDVDGKVIAWSGSSFTLNVSSGTLSTNYNGGTLNVAGVAMNVVSVSTNGGVNTVIVTAAQDIPFVLHDDDRPDGPPLGLPDTSKLEEAFQPAYVVPKIDAGISQTQLPFIRNIRSDLDVHVREEWSFDASADEANVIYWTVYLRGAFQHSTDADSDPNLEGAVLGIVDDINGRGANIYKEVLQVGEFTPNESQGKTEAYTVAHEIGHLFEGEHTDGSSSGRQSSEAGLMAQTKYRTSARFVPVTLNKIRKIPHP